MSRAGGQWARRGKTCPRNAWKALATAFSVPPHSWPTATRCWSALSLPHCRACSPQTSTAAGMGNTQTHPRLGTADLAQACSLLRSVDIPERVPLHFWSVFWDAPDSATEVYSMIQPEGVRAILQHFPRNMARLFCAVRAGVLCAPPPGSLPPAVLKGWHGGACGETPPQRCTGITRALPRRAHRLPGNSPPSQARVIPGPPPMFALR